ncbi:MAG: VOC family protein [Gemmatimonadetes bacterium]|nr:VOC family protein [Gemmatimonadota bacterium]
MREIHAYLNFDGNCREAMTFYQQCLGGELHVMTFGEGQPDSPPETKDRVIHARLTKERAMLMASDTMPGMPFRQGTNVWLSLDCESAEEVDSLYAALAEGGNGTMPPHDSFWGARFAMLTDRFGTNWMFNHEKAEQH